VLSLVEKGHDDMAGLWLGPEHGAGPAPAGAQGASSVARVNENRMSNRVGRNADSEKRVLIGSERATVARLT
jgi:hypothetical protein